jgi:hypothetical protein
MPWLNMVPKAKVETFLRNLFLDISLSFFFNP